MSADRQGRGGTAANGTGARRPGGGIVLNLLLAAISLTFIFITLEFGLRLYHGELLDFSSQLPVQPNRATSPIADYDAELGWVPRPGTHERGGERWSVNDAGLRNNGPPLQSDERPIVVVGDSFTFGDEVGDAETWPARLEARLGVPVINGGVFAYGVDQAYLRATQLIETYDPGTVLLAFISDDITRAEFSFYSGWKPYFEFDGGALMLRNVPVPTGRVPGPRFSLLRDVISHSFVASALARRLAPNWWSFGAIVRAHNDGQNVAPALFARLDSLARSRNATFSVVVLGTSGRMGGNRRAPGVVEASKQRGIDVIDLLPIITAVPADSTDIVFMGRGHFSPLMNDRVAGLIADHIKASR